MGGLDVPQFAASTITFPLPDPPSRSDHVVPKFSEYWALMNAPAVLLAVTHPIVNCACVRANVGKGSVTTSPWCVESPKISTQQATGIAVHVRAEPVARKGAVTLICGLRTTPITVGR